MTTQLTLTGDEAPEREQPDTLVTCEQCGERIMRTDFLDHPCDVIVGDDDDDDDEPERVGSMYDITLEYSTTYRLRVPAWSEHEAEDRAKDLVGDLTPADRHHLHTDRREISELTTDDVPDDYDPYGSEPLADALDRANDDT